MRYFILLLSFVCIGALTLQAQNVFKSDSVQTKDGSLIITFIGHGTLMFNYNGIIIHVDPVGRYADYSTMPKADLILVTHQHGDHLDPDAINLLKKDKTDIICTQTCAEKLESATVMKNGDTQTLKGISIHAVPAYNLVHKRDNGDPFHPKGQGNGYVLTFSDKEVYVAGDTENIPEMKDLKNIDIAFLPMNLPYTMTPEMVADAVKMFHPKILYPYHYGDTNINELLELLKDAKDCEIRVRDMK
jgi:L-ascorbate metabolism protein UlaG (beta-lactamase superfamily)